jgi:hypothetical protein
VTVRDKIRINGDSAMNHHLMDEESIEGTVIPQEMSSSWARNLPEEFLFCWELPAQGRRIHWRNRIPLEITIS